MKKILLIISLILGIFAAPVFAAEETVVIDSVATEGVYIGQTFPVGIAIYEAQPNTTFYYKFYGGIGDNQNYIQNSESLTYDTNWSSFPTFTTDSNGNAYVDAIAYIKTNSPVGYYDLYVQLAFPDYSSPTGYISIPQPIRVISLIVPTHTPTPTLTPSPTPTLAPNITPNPTTTSTSTPTPTPIITNNRQIPILTPTPTIIPQKFGTIATASALTSIAPSGSMSDTTLTDLDNNYIQTGSNPSKPSELSKVYKTSGITNLGAKIFFIFLLVSVSFTLYCLCFFGYTLETLLPEINQLLFQIKTQSIKVFVILKKSSKKISQYLQNLFISIKSYIKNSKVIKKLFSNFSKMFFVLLKISLNIFQKIIKYCYYISQKLFTFIKKHIKVPRKIKRYRWHLTHQKTIISILVCFSIISYILVRIILAADYYSNGETLLNNTVSISGTTGDLQVDDTSYRVLRSFPTAYTADFQTVAVDTQTTVGAAANTYIDKTVMTWNVPATGNYLIYATAEIRRQSATAARTAKAQMTIDGTSYAESFVADDVGATGYRTFSGVEIQSLAAGSHTVKIQFARTNASSNICYIKNARITAMRVDNHQLNIPANGTTTATNYADIATLTFTPKTTEDWLIMAHADVTSDTLTTLSYANLMVGATQLSETAVKIANASHFLPFDSYKTISLNANTSYTFKIQMKSSAAATITYKNVGLYAIPKSIFSQTANAENIGETSTSVGTSSSPTDVDILSFTPGVGATYLVTATGEQKSSSLSSFTGVRLNIGGSNSAESVVDVGNTAHWTSFSLQKVVNLAASSQTIKVQLFRQTTGNTASARNVRIQAIKLGAASGQKMEVEYTGVGNTLNWTKIDYLVNSGFSVASVGTTLQLWNYNSSTYPASGDGFLSYTSSATPDTFEEYTQSITTNPAYFRHSTTGEWKLKIKSITANGTWIDWSGDLLKYIPTVALASTAPVIPTLISPSNSATGQTLTPTFKTVTTDANGDNVQYELKICTDSDMTANCQTFDQTASNIGWSSQDVGTSAYSSGTTATYILQVGNSLAENTTYYWKTRAKDYAGTNTWSSTQTTPYSFTTISPNLTQASFRWSADDASGEARSDWYDSNYDYRIPITVTNNVGVILTNFQVSISIGTSQLIAQGKMQSDCDDIRITDINGNLLPHWIEENNPGCNKLTNTKIWIKANSLPNSDSTVYLYYGNSIANNNENGDNVFDFFDNFNSGSLDTNIWTATGGYSLSNNELTITTGAIYSKAPILQNSQNYIYEYRNKWSNTIGDYAGLNVGNASYINGSNSGKHKLVLFMCSTTNLAIYGFAADGTVASYNIAGGGTQYTATGNVYNTNGFSIDSTNIKYFNNYSQLNSYFGTWSAPPYLWLGYYYGSESYTTDIRDLTIDWVRARKYTATEPTFSLGTETTEPPVGSSGATWLAAENVGVTGVSSNSNIRLRFSIGNTGSSDDLNFRLQIAPKGGSTNCTDVASGSFADVTTTIGSNLAVMTTSPNFTNQQSTTHQLSNLSTFATGTTYPTLGTNPYSVTSADFNGDGKPDLVSANWSGNNITVFNNNGNGTFATGTTYPTLGTNPQSVTSTDVNGDGYPDLVTANYGSANITVFNNNGNGTFGTGTTYPTLGNSLSVTSADVNGDGKPDLVSANWNDSITVFTNNGNGTFSTGTTYPTLGTNPRSVTSADVNGDGKPDLVSANWGTPDSITVFNNNGNGTFGTGTTYPTLGTNPYSVTSADVNGDGKPDLVSANGGTPDSITVFNNNGNGTFATGTTYPTFGINPTSVTSADVNGDGKPDLVSANWGDSITVFNNNGNGTFGTGTTYPTLGAGPESVISADVNGDGLPDLVTANYTSHNITVFNNNGNGTFVAGKMVEYDSNQSDSISLGTNEFTEVEYNFQMTSNVGATTPYCFRVVNVGTTLNTYTNVAQLTTVLLDESTPTIPTLIVPADSATGQSLTPTFKTVTTDSNNDNLQYELKICTNSGMTANCQTFDQTASNIGWSSQDVGTSAYSSGTTATYILQVGNSLTENTTYYWKTRAKDYAGSATWSETQTTPYSFFTNGPTILNQSSFRWVDDTAEQTSWYGSNWPYRKKVTINSGSSDTGTNFQVKVKVGQSSGSADYDVHLTDLGNTDFSDVRFTSGVGTSILDFWLESISGTSPNQTATYWVEVADNLNSNQDIYVYYGNSSTTSASNIHNTFLWGDDFENSSWTYSQFNLVNYTGSTQSVEAGEYSMSGPAASEPIAEIYENSSLKVFPDSYIAEAKVKGIIKYGSAHINGKYLTVANKYEQLLDIQWNNATINKVVSNVWTNLGNVSIGYPIVENNWYKLRADVINVGTTNYLKTWIDDVYKVGATDSSLSYTGLAFLAYDNVDAFHIHYDDFRVRKYAATEPSIGTVGNQEIHTTWLAAENVGVTGVSSNSNIRLRFSIGNTGSSDDLNFRLQIAPKGGSTNCTDVASGSFADVTTTIGSNLAVMTTSPNFTNQEATTNQLTDSATTFVAGKMVEYNSNQSDSITLSTNEFTEVEYNFQMTDNVGSTTPYCFRVVDVGTTLNTYTNVAQLTTVYIEVNVSPLAPYLPYINNTTAQSGQQTPVYGLIDHTPVFSAVFDDPNTSNTAASYQLQIGSDSDWASAEIWDSTKTAVSGTCNENSRCADIVYSGGTSLVDGSTYYWRLKYWDNFDIGGSWSDTQQFSINSAPSVSDVTINGNNSINLSENSSIGISWIGTVTDADSYTNLSSVTGKIYRSGVGQSCTPNNNNCYTDTSCDFINCADDHCTALCSADLYFFTQSTAIGSTYANQYYQAWIEATDLRSEVGSSISTSTTIDVNNLSAFRIGSSLVYGEVFAGSDTGSSNTVTTVTNTGNSLINLEITGDYMCTDYPSCGGQSIEPHYQEYNTNTFTYGAGETLSLDPTIINIGISKPTQTPSNSSRNLYWGIGIPSSKLPGNYQGAVTILVD